MSGAHLIAANFSETHFQGVNFCSSRFGETTLSACQLNSATGLASAVHAFPSSLGLDTIYLSAGSLPVEFLRGCGVPEPFIVQLDSLIAAESGLLFRSCFISYSSEDEDFARRLYGRMRDSNIRVWFAPEDIKGGEKLLEQIETAIRVFDKLLVVLSPASMRSKWVKIELRKALDAEQRDGRRKLFPVRLTDFGTVRDWECFDADIGTDLATELREYFIPDFSNWKDHDSFEAAFERLLNDLRAANVASGKAD